MAAGSADTQGRRSRLPQIRGWFIILAGLAFGAGYLYHLHLQDREVFINSYYFRTLQEVATEFNNNLDQLVRLHEYGESRSTILSIFASYREEDIKSPGEQQQDRKDDAAGDLAEQGEEAEDTGYTYTLEANRLKISTGKADYSVDIGDLLPEPANEFVLYVIADEHNRVLSSAGGASGLSMIDTDVVSRAIQLRDNQDWLKLATQQRTDAPQTGKSLPGYSTQIDVDLNTGTSRVFALPFILHHRVGIPAGGGASTQDGDRAGGKSLYLLGIQPENVIDAYDNKRWNLSLLLLSLAGLVFLWTITRLLMLSRHQPIGDGFYRTTMIAAYGTFILLVALLLAFAQRNAAVADRQDRARSLMAQVFEGAERDLYTTFAALEEYRRTYAALLGCAGLGEYVVASSIEQPRTASPPAGNAADQLSELSQQTIVIGSEPQLRIRRYAGRDLVGFLCGSDGAEIAAPGGEDAGLPRFSKVNVYGHGARVRLDQDDDKVSEWFDIGSVEELPGRGRLLSVFLMDADGRQVLPMFYFNEYNNRPKSYGLAHRDYFRRVRDRSGWDITVERPESFHGSTGEDAGCSDSSEAGEGCAGESVRLSVSNVYIQRLLNINTGTRGSTLGMPLQPVAAQSGTDTSDTRFILGSDIVLPSLSLTAWTDPEAVQDMVFMVIDRDTGQVLYHMDADRAMVENLYRAGRGAADISRRVSSGRLGGRAVSGFYHGEAGQFLSAPLPVSQWAIVVFIPGASTDSLMTNAFLVNVGGMTAALLVLSFLIYLLRRRVDSDGLKRRWGIPAGINRHGLMLFSSILLAAVYAGFRLGGVVEREASGSSGWDYPVIAALLALAAVLLWGYRVLRRLRRQDRRRAELESRAGTGDLRLFALFLLIGGCATAYLWYMGDKPGGALRWYYHSLHEARLNQEQRELHNVALTRFPNSIKLHGADPLSLVPIEAGWRSTLSDPCVDSLGRKRVSKQPHVMPEDVGTFSQLTASTDPYDWVLRYLLDLAPGNDREACPEQEGQPGKAFHQADADGAQSAQAPSPLPRFIAVMGLGFLILCIGWQLFYRWLLHARLIGPPGLLEHLRHIVSRNLPERSYGPRPGMVLDLRCRRPAGEDLAALLHRHTAPAGSDPATRQTPSRRGTALLLQECPCLRDAAAQPDCLPGVSVSFHEGEPTSARADQSAVGGPLRVELSDLDTCLSQSASRSNLLRLLRQLKAICLSGELAELRVSLGFHSYEALLLKAHNLESELEPMSEAEFAGWAETLMDFSVELPEDLLSELDPGFLQFECAGSSLLRGLPEELLQDRLAPAPTWPRQRRWLLLRDVDKTGSEWATINCILLKAGALFRHKWETCSSAEKLALYNLARKRRINAANAQLLEQLALQGLIRVDHGRVRIVNNSFAYFARHAEDTASLRHLVEIGEVGVWQEYRLPVTLVILLVLGGIAFTSGSSLYLIAASLLGLLGTIGSLTSSAQMIRENLR